MACNLPRWNWLIQGTYNGLPSDQRMAVMDRFFKRTLPIYVERFATKDDAENLYQVMVELGIEIKGTDPCPPKPPPQVTQAGADEYEEIMTLQETVKLHRKLDKKSTAS